jgi:hypothetical protein
MDITLPPNLPAYGTAIIVEKDTVPASLVRLG